jgi:hypothetical protein
MLARNGVSHKPFGVNRPGWRQGGPHHRLPGRSAAERRPAPVGRRRAEISSRAANPRHHLRWPCSPRVLLHTATEAAVRQDAGKPWGSLRPGPAPWCGKVSHLSPARREVLRHLTYLGGWPRPPSRSRGRGHPLGGLAEDHGSSHGFRSTYLETRLAYALVTTSLGPSALSARPRRRRAGPHQRAASCRVGPPGGV